MRKTGLSPSLAGKNQVTENSFMLFSVRNPFHGRLRLLKASHDGFLSAKNRLNKYETARKKE
jgi:hypothetical protein